MRQMDHDGPLQSTRLPENTSGLANTVGRRMAAPTLQRLGGRGEGAGNVATNLTRNDGPRRRGAPQATSQSTEAPRHGSVVNSVHRTHERDAPDANKTTG